MPKIRVANIEDAEAIAAVHVTGWRESYSGLVPQPVLDGLSIPDRAAKWRQAIHETQNKAGQSIFVAEKQGEIVGFVDGGKCRSDLFGREMEVYAIYLLQRIQRVGRGTALLNALFSDFISQAAYSAGVWVLRDNHPARRFYEKRGAQYAADRVEQRPGYALIEVGYGWADIRSMAPTGLP
jgi:ribosomal protein S18 acetylase RimI-like enzyme